MKLTKEVKTHLDLRDPLWMEKKMINTNPQKIYRNHLTRREAKQQSQLVPIQQGLMINGLYLAVSCM